MVERVVNDIGEVVRHVRFDGWQDTHAREREVEMALRKTLFKHKLHQDQDLFDFFGTSSSTSKVGVTSDGMSRRRA